MTEYGNLGAVDEKLATQKPHSVEIGERTTEPLSDKMERILKRVQENASTADREESVSFQNAVEPETQVLTTAYRQRFLTNTAVRKRLAETEASFALAESKGLFVSYPISPGNEFPTLLTRLPIFRPTRRGHQQRLVNKEFALEFTTPFGDGKRHGPPLTVRDEDTLIALTRLRSKRVYGLPQSLPIPIADIYASKNDRGTVGAHYVVCSIDQVNRELGLTDGGLNYKRTFQSVKRLGATTLELNLKRHERYLGKVKTGRMLSLIHVQWQTFEENGLLVVLFPPVIANWLENEYTYIDWSVRLKLSDIGKCLHRFLSSQPKKYRGELNKIAKTIGYDGPPKNVKQRLRKALEQLVGLGWLKSYRISGNGRSQPLVLHVFR